MSLNDRIQTLRDRHAGLDSAIDKETSRPYPNPTMLNDMKRQKLRLKEEIEHLEHSPPR